MGALGTGAGIRQALPDTVEEKTWISSIKCIHAYTDFTAATDSGPIIVGVAHSDYTLAEIEEWIENTESWSESDLRQQEIAKRKIRRIGKFTKGGFLNDGKPITTKCGWMLTTGQNVAMWVWNTGAAAIVDGSDWTVDGHANLWPV